MNNWKDEIASATPSADEVGLVKLFHKDKLVWIQPNLEGKAWSLRALHGVLEPLDKGLALTPQGIKKLLGWFESLLPEAKQSEQAHPFLRWLMAVESAQLSFHAEVLVTSSLLFQTLLAGNANAEQKREAVELLDQGKIRCAEKVWDMEGQHGTWIPQIYAIESMNAAFSAYPMEMMEGGFYDKVPLKTEDWRHEDFEQAGVRFIPQSFVRKGAYVGKGTTVMPGGIVNTGAYVAGEGVMIDGGARVATGAQVGKGVKLGAGSGIEGILEPKGRLPSIVEDGAIIGANCEVAGIVEEKAILASGTVMASGKKIFDLRTGKELPPRYMQIGEKVVEIPYIPAGRIAVNGVYMKGEFGISCILLLEKDASQASITDLPKNTALYIRA